MNHFLAITQTAAENSLRPSVFCVLVDLARKMKHSFNPDLFKITLQKGYAPIEGIYPYLIRVHQFFEKSNRFNKKSRDFRLGTSFLNFIGYNGNFFFLRIGVKTLRQSQTQQYKQSTLRSLLDTHHQSRLPLCDG